MHVLETYLVRLHEIRATERGTPELSYRAALEILLNAVGGGLDPAVQATAELATPGRDGPISDSSTPAPAISAARLR